MWRAEKNDGSVDEVLQFPNVSRPGISNQGVRRNLNWEYLQSVVQVFTKGSQLHPPRQVAMRSVESLE